jgi:hypothetical protein
VHLPNGSSPLLRWGDVSLSIVTGDSRTLAVVGGFAETRRVGRSERTEGTVELGCGAVVGAGIRYENKEVGRGEAVYY